MEAQHHSLAITTTGPSPEATGEWDHIADDIKRSFSSDIKTLHFEMIRQFHIQQVFYSPLEMDLHSGGVDMKGGED